MVCCMVGARAHEGHAVKGRVRARRARVPRVSSPSHPAGRADNRHGFPHFEELPPAFSAIQFMPTVMPRSALPVTSCFSLKSCAAFAASAAAFLAFSLMWCSRSSAAALSPIATVALPVACATWPTSSLRVAAYAAAPAATSPANGPTNASPTTPPATAAPPSTLLLVVAAAASCEFVCRCESGGGGGGGRFIFTLPSLHQRRTLLSSRRDARYFQGRTERKRV